MEPFFCFQVQKSNPKGLGPPGCQWGEVSLASALMDVTDSDLKGDTLTDNEENSGNQGGQGSNQIEGHQGVAQERDEDVPH